MKEYVSSFSYCVPRHRRDDQLCIWRNLTNLRFCIAVIGILMRCEKTGPCHPKTSSSLENIVNTKMQDFRSYSGRGTTDDSDDWVVGDQSQPMHRSFPAEKELPRHTPSFTSLTSSEIESERRNGSMSSLSCSASHTDDSEEATHDIESGIFELEL